MINCPICTYKSDINNLSFSHCENLNCQFNIMFNGDYIYRFIFEKQTYRLIATKANKRISFYIFENKAFKLLKKYEYYFQPPKSKEDAENLVKKLLLLCTLS